MDKVTVDLVKELMTTKRKNPQIVQWLERKGRPVGLAWDAGASEGGGKESYAQMVIPEQVEALLERWPRTDENFEEATKRINNGELVGLSISAWNEKKAAQQRMK